MKVYSPKPIPAFLLGASPFIIGGVGYAIKYGMEDVGFLITLFVTAIITGSISAFLSYKGYLSSEGKRRNKKGNE